MNKRRKWNTDVAVLLVFFVRDDTFEKVFESVRQAKPRRLLLWQDGPRANMMSDLDGVKKCRKIAENIDWECEVYRNYHEENMGCDPSTFLAFKWAFSIVDKCIILEDDQVPSQSFFRYCKELLDKYENDERINHICGYNVFGEAEWCPYDYMFAYVGSGAWASWRRVAEKWDSMYSFLDDTYSIDNLTSRYGERSVLWLKNAVRHKQTGKEYWESIIGMECALDSRYAIIPKYNLVKNLGISNNATHSSVSDLRVIPKEDRQIYINEAQDMSFPMRHPNHIIVDGEYTKRLDKMNRPSRFHLFCKKVEMAFNMLKYGYASDLIKRIAK